MKRYAIITRPARVRHVSADYDIGPDGENYLARTVHEIDHDPMPTGILDQYGNEIVSYSYRQPIGFVHFEE